jgi:4-amino-4-deoxy-L-arabinose transferase-like glycosyltransferase
VIARGAGPGSTPLVAFEDPGGVTLAGRRPPALGAARLAGALLRPRVAAAGLLVLLLGFGLLGQSPPVPVRDEPSFLAGAHRLLAGEYADTSATADPRDFLWHGLGLPAVLAPLVEAGLPLPLMRLLAGPLLLWAALLAFHRLLRRDLGERAAVAWTWALGLYAPFYAFLRQLQKEPLAILLVALALLALTRAVTDGRRRDVVAAGAALAALAMVRLEYGWVLVGLLVLGLRWGAVARARASALRLAAVAATGLALCLPWLGYTHAHTGQVGYWSSSGGLSLYWMSPTGPGQTGEWHSPRKVRSDAYLARYRPFFARVERLSPLEQDAMLRRAALDNIRADPARYVAHLAANTGRLVFHAPTTAPPKPGAAAGLIAFNVLLLAAVGWAAVRLRRRGPAPPAVVAVALLAACSVGVHLVASASPRMLMPVVPMLVWLVVQAWRPPPAPAPG